MRRGAWGYVAEERISFIIRTYCLLGGGCCARHSILRFGVLDVKGTFRCSAFSHFAMKPSCFSRLQKRLPTALSPPPPRALFSFSVC